MDILSNSEWQFIISTSIAILGIWIAFRRPALIPISYEALTIETVNDSKDEIKELVEKMQLPVDDEENITFPCFVTFKIWNSGKESVSLPDASKPLVIAFKSGERILGCESIETLPHDLELAKRTEAEKVLLNFPLLDPQEVMIFRVLLTNYVYYFPKIYVRVPGKKRIVRANNVRMAKEELIGALFFLCVAILGFKTIFFGSFFHNPDIFEKFLFIGIPVLFFLTGLLLLVSSWVSRRSGPYSDIIMLPSTMLIIHFTILLPALPILIGMGVLAAIIYAIFGLRILSTVFLMVCCLSTAFGMWYMLNGLVIFLLQKRKKSYNANLVGILAVIPSIVFLGLCVYVFVNIFQHW